MKELRCRDVGFACDRVIQGESEEQVLAQAAEHAAKDHGLNTMDDATKAKVRSQIHNV